MGRFDPAGTEPDVSQEVDMNWGDQGGQDDFLMQKPKVSAAVRRRAALTVMLHARDEVERGEFLHALFTDVELAELRGVS